MDGFRPTTAQTRLPRAFHVDQVVGCAVGPEGQADLYGAGWLEVAVPVAGAGRRRLGRAWSSGLSTRSLPCATCSGVKGGRVGSALRRPPRKERWAVRVVGTRPAKSVLGSQANGKPGAWAGVVRSLVDRRPELSMRVAGAS